MTEIAKGIRREFEDATLAEAVAHLDNRGGWMARKGWTDGHLARGIEYPGRAGLLILRTYNMETGAVTSPVPWVPSWEDMTASDWRGGSASV